MLGSLSQKRDDLVKSSFGTTGNSSLKFTEIGFLHLGKELTDTYTGYKSLGLHSKNPSMGESGPTLHPVEIKPATKNCPEATSHNIPKQYIPI